MDEFYYGPDSDDGAALAYQQELESRELAEALAAQLADRVNFERFCRYVDRVLELTVGKAVPF